MVSQGRIFHCTYHIKSLHSEQNVGCRNAVAINLCPLTWWTRRRIAPRRRMISKPSFSLKALSLGCSETKHSNGIKDLSYNYFYVLFFKFGFTYLHDYFTALELNKCYERQTKAHKLNQLTLNKQKIFAAYVVQASFEPIAARNIVIHSECCLTSWLAMHMNIHDCTQLDAIKNAVRNTYSK